MMYIGFSTQTHKLYARVLCKKFKHCAPVIVSGKSCCLYQFTNTRNINMIKLKRRDLKILEKHSWIFIKYKHNLDINNLSEQHWLTCVEFTKSVCGINNRHIITPYDLFEYLMQK